MKDRLEEISKVLKNNQDILGDNFVPLSAKFKGNKEEKERAIIDAFDTHIQYCIESYVANIFED